MATCPRCGSSVRRDSDWCTLCFADLRPVPPPRVSADPLVVPQPAAPALANALTGTAVATDPSPAATATDGSAGVAIACGSCGEPVSLDVGVCQMCGAGLFDRLKQDRPTLVLPVIGDVMRFGKGARAGLAVGFAALFIVVLFTVITILGKLV